MKKLLLLVVLMVLSPFNAKANEDVTSSTQWLDIVDNGDYSQSWHQADAFFQKNVTEDLWISKLKEVRTPLGDVESREQANRKTFTTLPQLPEGEYVMLQFNTDFANRPQSTESVTLKKSDGQWQVIGYFIQ